MALEIGQQRCLVQCEARRRLDQAAPSNDRDGWSAVSAGAPGADAFASCSVASVGFGAMLIELRGIWSGYCRGNRRHRRRPSCMRSWKPHLR